MQTQREQFTSPLSSILMSVFLFMMAVGLLNIFLSVRMTLAGISPQLIGIVMAAYFAGMIAGSLYAREIIVRVGHIRSFTAFAAVATAAAILHGLSESMSFWALLRIITGFSLAGLYMVVESWLHEVAPRNNRGGLFSLYMISNYVGIAAGQLMLNVADPMTNQLVLVVALLFALCLVPIALTHAHHPAQIQSRRIQLLSFIRSAPLGSMGSFSSGLIIGAYISLAPSFAVLRGMTNDSISIFMAMSMIGGLVLQWPIGKLSDRYERSLIMVAVGLMTAVMAGSLFAAQEWRWLMFTSAMLFGGLAYSIYPISVCHANDQTEDGDFVMTATGLLLLYGCGAAIGPIIGAAAMALFGPWGLFGFIVLVSLIFSGLAWRRHHSPATEQHHTDFIMVPRTTPMITKLDPRAESDTVETAS